MNLGKVLLYTKQLGSEIVSKSVKSRFGILKENVVVSQRMNKLVEKFGIELLDKKKIESLENMNNNAQCNTLLFNQL